MSKRHTAPEFTVWCHARPVVGEPVTGGSAGPWFTATWSGIYDGVRPADEDGRLYHYFRDGEVNGIPQGHFGFPVDQMTEGVRSAV